LTDYPQERKDEIKDKIINEYLGSYESIMKTALCIREDWFYPDSVEIVVKHDEGSYQGDSMALLKRWKEYYIANWGWGSCSGCDALEASSENPDSLIELVLDYQSSLSPKLETKMEVLEYISKERQNVFDKELLDNFESEVRKYFESQTTLKETGSNIGKGEKE